MINEDLRKQLPAASCRRDRRHHLDGERRSRDGRSPPSASEHRVWLHIDAAYGGGLALLPEARLGDGRLEDGRLARDQSAQDALCALRFQRALCARHRAVARRLYARARISAGDAGAEINYMDYGVQFGRRFRALKAWMVWRTFGREGMAARIREHLRLAQLFAGWWKRIRASNC